MNKPTTYLKKLPANLPFAFKNVLIIALVALIAATGHWAWLCITAVVMAVVWIRSRSSPGDGIWFVIESPDEATLNRQSSSEELNDWLSNPAYSHLPSNAYHRDT